MCCVSHSNTWQQRRVGFSLIAQMQLVTAKYATKLGQASLQWLGKSSVGLFSSWGLIDFFLAFKYFL